MLIQIAEEFVDSTLLASCQNAKHRKSNTVETKDVQLHLGITHFSFYRKLTNWIHLERTYSMWVPGFGTEDPKQYKKFLTNDLLKAVSVITDEKIIISLFSHWKHHICLHQRIPKHQIPNNNRLNRVNNRNVLFFSLSSVSIVKNGIKINVYILDTFIFLF